MRLTTSVVWILSMFLLPADSVSAAQSPDWLPAAVSDLEARLVAEYGEGQRDRIEMGLGQVADFWRVEDGDRTQFESFVTTNFAGDQKTLDMMFERMAKMGAVTPDLWMENATGAPVGPEAMLAATSRALEKVRESAGS